MPHQEVQSEESEMLAWFDGACEPVNPRGNATFGVVIKDKDGTVLLKESGFAGKRKAKSNNVAEYAGVRQILKYLAPRPPGRVTIHGDSNLVINQLSGRWSIKKGLYLSIAMETKELLAHLRGLGWQINLCWIPREQNDECGALSRSNPVRISQNVCDGTLTPKREPIRKTEAETEFEPKREPSFIMYPNALQYPWRPFQLVPSCNRR
jgi:ribonuclease HI